MDKIYRVTTEGDCEGRTTRTIAYATGNKSDIMSFYDDQKYYGLRLEELNIVHITPDSAAEKLSILKRKKELEAELEILKKKLK